MITTIEEFKEKYDNSSFQYYRIWFRENQCSMDVLEYIVTNYKCDEMIWYYISMYQSLSESFIEKYKDRIMFTILFIRNVNSKFDKYKLLNKYLYRTNLYEIYIISIGIMDNNNEFIDIIKRVIKEQPHKYEIDKLSYELIR